MSGVKEHNPATAAPRRPSEGADMRELHPVRHGGIVARRNLVFTGCLPSNKAAQ